jgi:hypothetical protein
MKLEKLLAKQKELEAQINEARKQQREAKIRSLTRQAERLGLLDLDAEVVAIALESAARSLQLTTVTGEEQGAT